jgi:hypothetical protein
VPIEYTRFKAHASEMKAGDTGAAARHAKGQAKAVKIRQLRIARLEQELFGPAVVTRANKSMRPKLSLRRTIAT